MNTDETKSTGKKDDRTFKEILAEAKKKKGHIITMGLGINQMPVWLYEEFTQDIKERYNDIYWVKLMDLMRKANMYDYLMGQNDMAFGPEELPIDKFGMPEKEDKEDGVKLMNGKVIKNG